jgi:hypothetical protein
LTGNGMSSLSEDCKSEQADPEDFSRHGTPSTQYSDDKTNEFSNIKKQSQEDQT